MDPSTLAFAKGIALLVTVAGTALTGFRLWLVHRRTAEPGADQRIDVLHEHQAQLEDAVEARLAELESRLDFAERQLLQHPAERRLPDVRMVTPV